MLKLSSVKMRNFRHLYVVCFENQEVGKASPCASCKAGGVAPFAKHVALEIGLPAPMPVSEVPNPSAERLKLTQRRDPYSKTMKFPCNFVAGTFLIPFKNININHCLQSRQQFQNQIDARYLNL